MVAWLVYYVYIIESLKSASHRTIHNTTFKYINLVEIKKE